jgi:class 3 adenylate cyclase
VEGPNGVLASNSDGSPFRGLPGSVLTGLWIIVVALPIIGFVSLLERSNLDPEWTSARLHFVLFLAIGLGACILAYLAGQAADRRGDARVLLLSMAFLVTGGFLAVHALGTPGILLNDEKPGFATAIPVGMFLASLFALGSAFVDYRPGFAPTIVRHRITMRRCVYVATGLWILLSLLELPPLAGTTVEGVGGPIQLLAALGAALYTIAAIRYLVIYRGKLVLLPASIIGCFVLLAEAMFGSALVTERTWHASWWEWHGLIVIAYLIVLFAARQQWSEERFRHLYLHATRERTQTLSVLFADLENYTTFVERADPAEISAMLSAFYALATPILSEGFGGRVEKFIGDAIMASFNSRGDQPDHALRATRAGLELQRQMALLLANHPSWPRPRVAVNSGDALIRELGGPGHVAYEVIGDTINVGARLESEAPVGGVLIGSETFRCLPPQSVVESRPGLRVKGKQTPVDAYLVHSVPA